MRTKTLLLTAALTAAGVATSMAQVYSVNMVGYINCAVPSGFSMLANQLDASPDNKVSTVLASAPNGTQVYKYDRTSGGFVFITFIDGAWEGDDVDMTLAPGEGIFINPGSSGFTATFVGEVRLNSSISIAPGFQIVSSALPQSLPLTDAPPAGLGYPVANGDQTYQLAPGGSGYVFNTYIDGAWEGDGGGATPTPLICEPFWLNRQGAAVDWTRTFSVGP